MYSLITLLCLLLFPGAAFAIDFFVNGQTGVDSATCGQQPTSPCKTIKKALSNIPDGEVTIKIARGEYMESDMTLQASPSVKNTLTFEGGWNSDFSSQELAATSTIIHPADTTSSWYSLFHLAIYDSNSDMSITIRHLTIKKDQASTIREGIALVINNNGHGTLIVNNTIFSGFEANAIRLYCKNSGVIQTTVLQSVFHGNNSEVISGGSRNNGQLTLTMRQNMLRDNSRVIDLYSKDSGVMVFSLENTIIAHNTASEGGMAMRLSASGSGSIEAHSLNNTITDNTSENYGGAVDVYASASGTVRITMINTILKNNHARISADDLSLTQGYLNDYTGEILFNADYCMLGEYAVQHGTPSYISTNEVNGDPGLDSTYHLTAGSAAKDAGLCGYLTGSGPYQYHRVAPDEDIDGDPRPGWGILTGCDIGADEYRFPWILFNPATRGTRSP